MSRKTKSKVNSRKEREVFENCEKDLDLDHRRTSRTGTIISIFAVLCTVFGILWKFTIKSYTIIPQFKLTYYWVTIGFLLAVSIAVVIIKDIILFIVADLQRYNLRKQNYKEFDEKSDDLFNALVDDFVSYLKVILTYMLSLIIMDAILCDDKSRWIYIVIIIEILVCMLVIIWFFREKITKEKITAAVKKYLKKIGVLLVFMLFCFEIAVIIAFQKQATINCTFGTNGEIELCNSSGIFNYGLNIEIYDEESRVYEKNIKIQDKDIPNLLRSREEVYKENIGEKNNRGYIWDKELLNWKYVLDLKDLNIDDEKVYYIEITVNYDGNYYEIKNEFYKNSNTYLFCTEKSTKTY